MLLLQIAAIANRRQAVVSVVSNLNCASNVTVAAVSNLWFASRLLIPGLFSVLLTDDSQATAYFVVSPLHAKGKHGEGNLRMRLYIIVHNDYRVPEEIAHNQNS